MSEEPRYLIPSNWKERPDLLPALHLLVQGARRVAQRQQTAAAAHGTNGSFRSMSGEK